MLALLALAALALVLPSLKGDELQHLAVFATPIAGALGVSLASVGRTVRKSLDARAELLWNTALVEVISQKTLHVEELLPAPPPRAPGRPRPRRCGRRPVLQRNRVA